MKLKSGQRIKNLWHCPKVSECNALPHTIRFTYEKFEDFQLAPTGTDCRWQELIIQ